MSEGVRCFSSDHSLHRCGRNVVQLKQPHCSGYADCVLVNAHIWQSLLSSISEFIYRHNSKHSKKAYRMDNVRCHLLLVIALVAAVNSQSYPQFEFRGDVLVNNSLILRPYIGESHNDSLHCVTDNSDCCSNGEGNWYDVTGGEVHQGPDGDSDSLYVTRGDGVVYLNRRRGGNSTGTM